MERANRPLGITIICLLGWLGAVITIASSVFLISASFFMVGLSPNFFIDLLAITGIAVFAVGLFLLVALYWLWKMQKKGWTIVMILEFISILINLVNFNISALIIPIIIVVYLWIKKDLFR